jgi:hypothetical protein
MSLTASMQSWCDTFKNGCKERAGDIDGLIKQTNDLVSKYYDNRLRLGAETKKQLELKYSENQKRVAHIINEYTKDRKGAADALSTMRK